MQHQFDIHDKREQNKIGLETYHMDKSNIFDLAIDKLIDELKKEVSDTQNEFDSWHELEEKDPERYAELTEQAERYEISIHEQQYGSILEIIHNEEKLLSLVEMKVIYAFKFIEINIKKLLRAAFSLESTRDFFKWDNIVKFLKDKKIDITSFESYFIITQLKKVNNAIKHSDDYEVSLTSINEFKESDKLTYSKIDTFYTRIKEVPTTFLQELISAIYNELYEFNESKIDDIAKSFVLRMSKSDADDLANKIKNHY